MGVYSRLRSNEDFLNWVADRLVTVHGDNRNTDFVIRLRKVAREISDLEERSSNSSWNDSQGNPTYQNGA